MKLKIKAKAILGAAAVMMGIFAPMFSANAKNTPLHELIRIGGAEDAIISLAEECPDWLYEKDDAGYTPSDLLWHCMGIPECRRHWKADLPKRFHRVNHPLERMVQDGDREGIKRFIESGWDFVPSEIEYVGRSPSLCVCDVDTLECLYEGEQWARRRYHQDIIINWSYLLCSGSFGFNYGATEYLIRRVGVFTVEPHGGKNIFHALFERLKLEPEKLDECLKACDLWKKYAGQPLINWADDSGRNPIDGLYEWYDFWVHNSAGSDAEKVHISQLRECCMILMQKYGAKPSPACARSTIEKLKGLEGISWL